MAPPGKRIFAVGDIHGRFDLLTELMGKIREYARAAGAARNSLVFLGDYIDRGPQSKEVVAFLSSLSLPGWEASFLRGNHDQAFLDFLNDPSSYRAWRSFGAPETLLGYGVLPPRFDDESAFAKARDELARNCPPQHLQFFHGLEDSHEEGDYLFVHAGIRPGIPLNRQVREDLLWIREEFLLSDRLFDKIIVHGPHSDRKPRQAPQPDRPRHGCVCDGVPYGSHLGRSELRFPFDRGRDEAGSRRVLRSLHLSVTS